MLEEATMQPERRSVEAAVRLDSSAATASGPPPGSAPVFAVSEVNVAYGGKLALKGVAMEIFESRITAFIGPSGCGKCTYIRCFNRMNDLIPGAEVKGEILVPRSGPLRARRRPRPGSPADRHGLPEAEPVPVKSIYENVAYGPRVLGITSEELDDRVERSLAQAALWDEVKDRLKRVALRALRRTAAAPLHRARARGRAGRAADGRAVLGARPIATARIEDLMAS